MAESLPPEFKPVMYRRYVDDTFLLFRDSSYVLPFRRYLNNQHSRIEFTSETEINNSLNFFNVQINRKTMNFQQIFTVNQLLPDLVLNTIVLLPKYIKQTSLNVS